MSAEHRLGKIKTGQQCTVRIDDGEKGYQLISPEQSAISLKKQNLLPR